ncbi:signal peptidase I [Frondihabitans sp. PhB188]|uniref:signal peptidase I n=1 Tax=Frondihabitans sp. PhB188 TaxID=2485200 RepID=UPI000F4AF46B|nr:signal peptidase I [Frondihabitans sp. PhB188]ROQ39542.1 signal peptidase I [Frondihabitans sp. PhB188]
MTNVTESLTASRTVDADLPTGARPRPRQNGRQKSQTVLIWLGAAAAAVLVVLALMFHAQGGRWFIVQTPSMGTAAPVGTLVLTTPVEVADLHTGDVLTFHPPTETGEVFTHRIVAIDADGISTRGDINGATDPWRLHQADLVGKTTTILPMAGWLVRALPILLVGAAFVLIATRLIANPARRMSFRILGFSMLASLTVYVLKPFVGLVVLTTAATKTGGVSAQIVSTGILPITATAKGGTSVDLHAGEVGTLTVRHITDLAHYSVSSQLHLTLPEWILFGVICAIPMLFTFVVGLPSERVEDGEAAAAAAALASSADRSGDVA